MKRLENRLNVTDDEARVLALLAAVVMLGMVVFSFALGETEPWQESRWVFCDGTLRVRSAPGGEVAGYVFLGDEVTVDRLKGDWAHLTGLSIEAGEGWVAVRYLADSKATILRIHPVRSRCQPSAALFYLLPVLRASPAAQKRERSLLPSPAPNQYSFHPSCGTYRPPLEPRQ